MNYFSSLATPQVIPGVKENDKETEWSCKVPIFPYPARDPVDSRIEGIYVVRISGSGTGSVYNKLVVIH